MSHMRPGSRVLRAAGSVVVLLAALVSASCDIDGLLRVSDPSRLMAEDTETPASARTLVNGVIADFECAFGAYVLVGGILSDELMDQQFNGSGWYLDRRDVTPSDVYGTNGCTNHRLPGIDRPASTARWVADNVYGLLSSWTDEQVPQRDSLMATSALYAGFSYSMLGTLMCSAALDGGPEVSSEELLAIAEERFHKRPHDRPARGTVHDRERGQDRPCPRAAIPGVMERARSQTLEPYPRASSSMPPPRRTMNDGTTGSITPTSSRRSTVSLTSRVG